MNVRRGLSFAFFLLATIGFLGQVVTSSNASQPSAPSVVLVGEANATAATFRVTPSANNGSAQVTYEIFYLPPNNTLYKKFGQVVDLTEDQTISPLRPKTLYYVFVKATNTAGYSDSRVISFNTTKYPTAPSKASIVLVGKANFSAATVRIRPSTNNGGARVTYTIFYHIQNMSDFKKSVSVVNVTKDQTLSPLQPNTQYCVFVKATNVAGETDSNVINFNTTKDASFDKCKQFIDEDKCQHGEMCKNTTGSYDCLSFCIDSSSANTTKEQCSGKADVCAAFLSGSPRAFSNKTMTAYLPGAKLQVACPRGYTTSRKETEITCNETGVWLPAQSVPNCRLITCPNLSNTTEVAVSVSGLTISATATYQCQRGFTSAENSTAQTKSSRTCEEVPSKFPENPHNLFAGKWTGKQLECQLIKCTVLENPLNGKVSFSGFTLDSTATYSCNPPYTLISGSSQRSCLKDRIWSGTAPMCEVPTSSLKSSPTSSSKSNSSLSAVVGITIGSLLGFAAICFVAVLIFYMHQKRRFPNSGLTKQTSASSTIEAALSQFEIVAASQPNRSSHRFSGYEDITLNGRGSNIENAAASLYSEAGPVPTHRYLRDISTTINETKKTESEEAKSTKKSVPAVYSVVDKSAKKKPSGSSLKSKPEEEHDFVLAADESSSKAKRPPPYSMVDINKKKTKKKKKKDVQSPVSGPADQSRDVDKPIITHNPSLVQDSQQSDADISVPKANESRIPRSLSDDDTGGVHPSGACNITDHVIDQKHYNALTANRYINVIRPPADRFDDGNTSDYPLSDEDEVFHPARQTTVSSRV